MADTIDWTDPATLRAAGMTPLQKDQVARTQALAKILGKNAPDTSPVFSPAAGWARVLQGALEGYGDRMEIALRRDG